jgi:hypothetical protein
MTSPSSLAGTSEAESYGDAIMGVMMLMKNIC